MSRQVFLLVEYNIKKRKFDHQLTGVIKMFKPHCTSCHKKLKKNDPIIMFGKSNIWHENCYKQHLEKNSQNSWSKEIALLKKVKKALTRIRNKILISKTRGLDYSKLLKEFYTNNILLKSIIETSEVLNIIPIDKMKESLEQSFKKIVKILIMYSQLLEEYSFYKTELTLEMFKENNFEVFETIIDECNELTDELMDIHDNLKSLEDKVQSNIRKEILKKIDEIPNRIKRF